MRLKQLVISWDIWAAIATAIPTNVLLPAYISIYFCKDAYFVGITVLSIIFAIFLASVSIIMASTDDNFVCFLEERGHYTTLINTFRYTLILLFLSLLISMALYFYTTFLMSQALLVQTKWLFTLFIFTASYALFAVCISSVETLTYSKYRTQFLRIERSKDEQA